MAVSATDPSGTVGTATAVEGRPSRRLAVVLSADVAGYSALTEADDEAAFAALASSRAIFEAQVRARGGRVFGAYGDSLMAEFGSTLK